MNKSGNRSIQKKQNIGVCLPVAFTQRYNVSAEMIRTPRRRNSGATAERRVLLCGVSKHMERLMSSGGYTVQPQPSRSVTGRTLGYVTSQRPAYVLLLLLLL